MFSVLSNLSQNKQYNYYNCLIIPIICLPDWNKIDIVLKKTYILVYIKAHRYKIWFYIYKYFKNSKKIIDAENYNLFYR